MQGARVIGVGYGGGAGSTAPPQKKSVERGPDPNIELLARVKLLLLKCHKCSFLNLFIHQVAFGGRTQYGPAPPESRPSNWIKRNDEERKGEGMEKGRGPQF